MSRNIFPQFAGAAALALLCACGGSGGSATTAQTPAAPAPTTIFAASDTTLYKVELSTTGKDTPVVQFHNSDGSALLVTDFAYDPKRLVMYACTLNTVYRVDPSTGVTTPFTTGLNQSNALAVNAAGVVWSASSVDGSVYNLGGVTPLKVGAFGSNYVSSGDMVFDSSDTLYATVHKAGDALDTLVTVNTATGVATVKFASLPVNIWGIQFADGKLYGFSGANSGLYEIDLTTGAAKFIRTLTFSPYGAIRANLEGARSN